MFNSDLRHAVASHFDNIVANLSKVEEFNSHFFNYLEGNKLPDEWFAYLKDLKEDKSKDGLQTFIHNNYPDKSEYQFADQAKIYFGHRVFEVDKLNKQLRRLLMSSIRYGNPTRFLPVRMFLTCAVR